MARSIHSSISEEDVKKILGNKNQAILFLRKIGIEINKSAKSATVFRQVVRHWDFKTCTGVVGDLFVETEKYRSGTEVNNALEILLGEWDMVKLGKVDWPFAPGGFDDFVQRINAEGQSGSVKDTKVKIAAVRYRRIKEINTLRNDFIETLVFEKNKNVLPTLSHRRGVDFFINGEQYDQKVSRSVGEVFKRDFGDSWRQKAINNPGLVAQYLYTHQDEGRFGHTPRLLVVNLDENVSADRIRHIINKTDLVNPIEVDFQFQHKNIGIKHYKTKCFVILLYT